MRRDAVQPLQGEADVSSLLFSIGETGKETAICIAAVVHFGDLK